MSGGSLNGMLSGAAAPQSAAPADDEAEDGKE
jgi:hypothetical protein